MTVIAYKDMPARFPTMPTFVAYLLLEHWAAPGWAYGVVYSLLGILWLTQIIRFSKQDQHSFVEEVGELQRGTLVMGKEMLKMEEEMLKPKGEWRE